MCATDLRRQYEHLIIGMRHIGRDLPFSVRDGANQPMSMASTRRMREKLGVGLRREDLESHLKRKVSNNNQRLSLEAPSNPGVIFGTWKGYEWKSIGLATPAPPPRSLDPRQNSSFPLGDGNVCMRSTLPPRVVRTASGFLHAAQRPPR